MKRRLLVFLHAYLFACYVTVGPLVIATDYYMAESFGAKLLFVLLAPIWSPMLVAMSAGLLISGAHPNPYVMAWSACFILVFAIIHRVLWRRRVRRDRIAAGLCVACGYDLRASSGRCPECGKTVPDLSRVNRHALNLLNVSMLLCVAVGIVWALARRPSGLRRWGSPQQLRAATQGSPRPAQFAGAALTLDFERRSRKVTLTEVIQKLGPPDLCTESNGQKEHLYFYQHQDGDKWEAHLTYNGVDQLQTVSLYDASASDHSGWDQYRATTGPSP